MGEPLLRVRFVCGGGGEVEVVVEVVVAVVAVVVMVVVVMVVVAVVEGRRHLRAS